MAKNFESGVAYEERFDALVVYCSDGRFVTQCDDFLENSLGLTNCDRVVIPGGAGTLIGHERAAIAAPGRVGGRGVSG